MSDLHPDDEALSAHLDGEEPQLRVHVESCTACTARLAELRRVRAAVGTPVTPPPAWQRDVTIARALDAVARPGGARRARAGGIAAAILLVLGAAIGLSQLSHSAKRAALKTTGAARGAEAGAAAPSTTAVAATDLGDLGALTDTAALRARVQPTVVQLEAGAPGAPNAGAPKAARTVPESAQTGRQSGTGDSAAARRCVDAARALDPANVSPAAAGTATWQGTPAEVLVYAAGRRGAARVYVLARADCRVLEFQSYAP
jgi:hypothetical protein